MQSHKGKFRHLIFQGPNGEKCDLLLTKLVIYSEFCKHELELYRKNYTKATKIFY